MRAAGQVSLSKGQSREGAFINRSLLTLGTVISKLSEGHAAHVPFRDSKLTRLLCSSLTGSGAKVAVIATITPASSQAEETHNTLKFATRAKKVCSGCMPDSGCAVCLPRVAWVDDVLQAAASAQALTASAAAASQARWQSQEDNVRISGSHRP